MRIEEFLPRSPYAASFDRGADRLVVVFSPVGARAGRFPGIAELGAGRYDVAAFNCPDEQWYVEGVPETADEPGRFEGGLRAFVAAGRYRRVLFCGVSKGAYGAVDFGLRCGATAILAAGLESIYGLCALFRRVVPPMLAERQRERLRDWPALARASGARIHSFYGVESVTDLLYARVAPRRLGAKALLVQRAGHFLLPVIEARVGFDALIEEVLERDRFGRLEASLVEVDLGRTGRSSVGYVQATQFGRIRAGFSPGIRPRGAVERYAAAAALIAQQRPEEALALLVGAPRGGPIRPAAWETLRARALLEAGRWAEAEPIARRLKEEDPTAHEPAQILYGALAADKRAEELAEVGFALYRADRERLGLLGTYLDHLAANGKKDEAAEILGGEIARATEKARLKLLYDLAARLVLAPETLRGRSGG